MTSQPQGSIPVVEIEASHLPQEIRVPDEARWARVLIRWLGAPVGEATLPTRDGRIARERLEEAVLDHASQRITEAEAEAMLRDPAPATAGVATVVVSSRSGSPPAELTSLVADGHEIVQIDMAERGLSRARNQAVRRATKDLVVFLHDRVRLEPLTLRRLLQNFSSERTAAAIGLSMPTITDADQGRPAAAFRREAFDGALLGPLDGLQLDSGGLLAVRRSVVDLVGEFDEALGFRPAARWMIEADFLSRILSRGLRIVYDPSAVSWRICSELEPDSRTLHFGKAVARQAAVAALARRHPLPATLGRLGSFGRSAGALGWSLLGNGSVGMAWDRLRSHWIGPRLYRGASRQLRQAG